MAFYREDIVTVELSSGTVFRSFLNHAIGSGDELEDRFGVRVVRNGEPESIGGTCFGLFIRADGETVAIENGVVNGNVAYVTLPEACYAVEGQFCLAIKCQGSGVTGTLRIVDGTVSRTSTDVIVDPGTIIPSIDALIEAIEEAEASIPLDYSALTDALRSGNIQGLANITTKYVNASGEETSNNSLRCSDYITIPDGTFAFEMYVFYNGSSLISPVAVTFDSSKAVARYFTGGSNVGGYKTFTLQPNEKYIRFNASNGLTADLGKYLFRFISYMESNLVVSAKLVDMSTGNWDLHNLDVNRIYSLYTTPAGTVSNMPFAGWRGNVFSVYSGAVPSTGVGRTVIALSLTNRMHICKLTRVDGVDVYSDWEEIFNQANTDFIGVVNVAFTSSVSTQIDYYHPLKSGKTYRFVLLNSKVPSGKRVRILMQNSNDIYVDINSFKNEALFTPNADTYPRFYALGGLTDFSGTFAIYECDAKAVKETKRTYYVDKNATYGNTSKYTSLTRCLLDLKDDEFEKTIYIEGGEYNIYQEYVDANVPVYTGTDPTSEYFDYCVWVPKNTHIIGRGNVKLKWMPDKEDVTVVQAQTVSPLNVVGSCTIENVEVYCKNGRYCLHNDGLGQMEFIGAIQKFINCKFYKYLDDTEGSDSYGKSHTIGFGIDARMRHEYINCEFYNEGNGSAFYGHTRAYTGSVSTDAANSPSIIVRDCIIKSEINQCARLDNSSTNSTLHVMTKFANCYFSGYLGLRVSPNAYDVTLLNCNNPEIYTDSSEYPPHIYPPVS